MPSDGSVTCWVQQLQAGERDAAQGLWERYFARLVGLARANLGGLPRGAADEEDVALSAFDSFCRAAGAGRFQRLEDRDDLWQLLVLLTARKAADLIEHEGRDKRNWRRRTPDEEGRAFGALIDREPDPAFAAMIAEEYRRLLDRLPDEQLRSIAVRKMEGHTNAEIAAELGCAVSTIERRLQIIRKCFENDADS